MKKHVLAASALAATSLVFAAQEITVSGSNFISSNNNNYRYSDTIFNFAEGTNTGSFIFWADSRTADIAFTDGTVVNGAVLVGDKEANPLTWGRVASNPNGTNVRIGWNNVSSYDATIEVSGNSSVAIGGNWIQLTNGFGALESGKVQTKLYNEDSSSKSYVHIDKLEMGLSGLENSTLVNSFEIGSNAELWTKSGIDIGKNGTSTQSTGGTVKVEMVGENNAMYVYGDSHIGNNNASAGDTFVYAKGTGSAQSGFYQDGGMNIHLSKKSDATMTSAVILDGNVEFKRPGGAHTTLNIGTDSNSAGGEASFQVKGANNFASIWNATLFNASATGGKATLLIEGSGSTINVNSELKVYGSGIVDGKIVGGELRFNIDDTGISTLFANKFSVFEGIITVDFTKILLNEVESELTILKSNNSLADLFTNDSFNFIKRDESDIVSWSLSEDSKSLIISYVSTIPEPSTYAAIFGAIALAFAAYRRRK